MKTEPDFFDRHDRFFETSPVGTRLPDGGRSPRLHNRYQIIIESNKALFHGARVLDLASHDGRWTMAALDAGAAFALGIEGREELVTQARRTFDFYGVDPSTYEFVVGDILAGMESLRDKGITRASMTTERFDIVMCLGFLYHTAQHFRVFAELTKFSPKYIIVDTKTVLSRSPVIKFHEETIDRPGRSLATIADRDTAVIGVPSDGMIRFLAKYLGFAVKEIDWSALGIEDRSGCEDYESGTRRTYLMSAAG